MKKRIMRFNESINKTNIDNYYRAYKAWLTEEPEEDNEPTNYERWMEVGQLTIKHHLSKEDVKYILDNYDTSFDWDGLLQSTYDKWTDNDDSQLSWDSLYDKYVNHVNKESRNHNRDYTTSPHRLVFNWLKKKLPQRY